MRNLLITGCVALSAGVLLIVPQAVLVDAELAMLLQAMALIKASLALGALLLAIWRFRLPIEPRIAGAYVGSIWLLTAATALIWQLAYLGVASTLYHVGLLVLLFTAFRDDRLSAAVSRVIRLKKRTATAQATATASPLEQPRALPPEDRRAA